jgi:uncharacterized membrane protein YkoI
VIRLKSFVLACAGFGLCAGITTADTRVKMEDLPPAVQKTVKEQSSGGTIRGLSKETEHGKTTYEAELTIDGKHRDIEMDVAGKVLEVEEQVAFGSIPAAAHDAIQKSAGAGKVLSVESVARDGQIVAYEAVVQKTAGGRRSEVRVDASGKPAPEN